MVEKKTETDNPKYGAVETRTEKEKTTTESVVTPERTDLERERIMSTATPEAEAERKAMLSKETEAERMKTGAAMTGAAVAAGAAASRTTPEAGERTIRQGAAIGTEPTTTRPATGTVVPPGTETVTPMKPYGTMDERARMHAEDPSIHPDWEKQPQINAPQDVGIPTAEGQADAARLRAGERRSDTAKEPRVDRRGGEYGVPLASSARTGTTDTTKRTETKDDRTMTEKAKDEAHKVKEETKMKAHDVKEDVDRKV